jgi:phospholipid/cholesterol/gamma-HCH transport system substrate-binding protein
LENKARYTLVGLFIIVFLLSLITFILWQAKYNFKDTKAYEYRLYTKSSVAGLNKNSFVEYKGLNIGIVEDIRINQKNLQEIEIILKINNPTMIKTDSFATIQSQGITGNKNVEIGGGSIDAQNLLPKNDEFAILSLEQSFFDNLTASAHDITQNINLTLYQLNKLLKDSNIKHIDNLLLSLHKNSENFNTTIEKFNRLLETNAPNTLANIDTLTKEWTGLSKELKELINNDITKLINKANTTIDSTSNLEDIFLNIENTIEKVDSTLDNLNENGGDIIFKTRDIKYGPQELQNENK